MRIVIAQTQQGFSTSRRMIEPSIQLFFIQCEQVIYFCLLQMKPETGTSREEISQALGNQRKQKTD